MLDTIRAAFTKAREEYQETEDPIEKVMLTVLGILCGVAALVVLVGTVALLAALVEVLVYLAPAVAVVLAIWFIVNKTTKRK